MGIHKSWDEDAAVKLNIGHLVKFPFCIDDINDSAIVGQVDDSFHEYSTGSSDNVMS